jgi:hypothetical protein
MVCDQVIDESRKFDSGCESDGADKARTGESTRQSAENGQLQRQQPRPAAVKGQLSVPR